MSAESVSMRVMACPNDGTILEHGIHSEGDGRYECPKCQRRWEAHEVVR